MTVTEAIQVGTLVAVGVGAFLNHMEARRAAKVRGQIHMLVNSNFGTLLHANMIQAKRISKMTKSKDDAALAQEAERLYNEHQSKQSNVDAGNKK